MFHSAGWVRGVAVPQKKARYWQNSVLAELCGFVGVYQLAVTAQGGLDEKATVKRNRPHSDITMLCVKNAQKRKQFLKQIWF